MAQTPQLKRTLSLGLLTLYGLGTTIGAGIFVLIGKVAGAGGELAPFSFLLAAAIAGLSALSFAEFSSRFPESAGEAIYDKEGLNNSTLALAVGLTVTGAGIVSTATIIVGFSGYLADVTSVPRNGAQVAMILLLAAIAIWGIRVSVSVAALVTLIEIGVLVVILGFGVLGSSEALAPDPLSPSTVPSTGVWSGVIYGALLAFYAFIGFEDIVNVAEETRDASRIVPRAILLTLAVTTLLYVAIAHLAVSTVAPATLATSDAPLTLLFERVSGLSGESVTFIAIVSVLNGALIQIIMASRVLFGLTRRGWLPGPMSYIHPKTRTPVIAIIACAIAAIVLSVSLPLENLALATSYLTLLIFIAVNAVLLKLKRKPASHTHRGFVVSPLVPVLAIASIGALIGLQLL
jgi:basic amino acid/polyamine antiporter, APA family